MLDINHIPAVLHPKPKTVLVVGCGAGVTAGSFLAHPEVERVVICEIEPPTTPDLRRVRHQIGVLDPVADAFLIPDNHLGRATVSSVAVAHEVAAMGGRSIACLNSRDRNLLGMLPGAGQMKDALAAVDDAAGDRVRACGLWALLHHVEFR